MSTALKLIATPAAKSPLEEALRQYKLLQLEEKRIEADKKILRPVIETACISSPDFKIEAGPFSAMMIEQPGRESIDLEALRASVPAEVYEAHIAPFIKKGKAFTQLKVA